MNVFGTSIWDEGKARLIMGLSNLRYKLQYIRAAPTVATISCCFCKANILSSVALPSNLCLTPRGRNIFSILACRHISLKAKANEKAREGMKKLRELRTPDEIKEQIESFKDIFFCGYVFI